MNIKKGDQVKIMAGKDRGKAGAVLKVFPELDKVTVEGLNLFRKKVRPKKAGQKGEVVSVARPLSAANVMLVCRNCKQPTRVGYRLEGDKKIRYCKKCEVSQ